MSFVRLRSFTGHIPSRSSGVRLSFAASNLLQLFILFNMPRLQYVFVIAAPMFAIFLVIRSFAVNPNLYEAVAQRLSLSWPLAVHPDFEDAQLTREDIESQYHMNDDHRHTGGDNYHPTYPHQHGGHHGHQHRPGHASEETPTYSRRIVAVGDLHGDLPNAHAVLQMAGVVDAKGNWANGVDFLVQTGDIIDRYVELELPAMAFRSPENTEVTTQSSCISGWID